MKRRTLLLSGLAAVFGLAAGRLLLGPREEQAIAMVVLRRLDYLHLDPDGVQQFARDMARLHVISRSRLRALAFISPVYTHFALSEGQSALAGVLRHGEDRLVSTFLISSDFFAQGADTARTVKYLGLLDPRHACGNPFARPAI